MHYLVFLIIFFIHKFKRRRKKYPESFIVIWLSWRISLLCRIHVCERAAALVAERGRGTKRVLRSQHSWATAVEAALARGGTFRDFHPQYVLTGCVNLRHCLQRSDCLICLFFYLLFYSFVFIFYSFIFIFIHFLFLFIFLNFYLFIFMFMHLFLNLYF